MGSEIDADTMAADIMERISSNLHMESWVEGKTLTVMFDGEDGERRFAKLRLTKIAEKPSAADLKGEPE